MQFLSKYKSYLILLALIIALVIGYQNGLGEVLTLENLKDNQESLASIRDDNYLLFVLGYILVYIISVAFSIPGATILTLAGGLLFGLVGTLFVIMGATIGAILTSILTRSLFRSSLEEKFSKQLKQFNERLQANEAGYLLTLRLLPIFPFFLINILAGLSRTKLSTFAWTTALGIIPGTFAYVNAGTQLSTIEKTSDILSPGLIGAFVFLAIISLVPGYIKKYLDRNKKVA